MKVQIVYSLGTRMYNKGSVRIQNDITIDGKLHKDATTAINIIISWLFSSKAKSIGKLLF